MNREELAEHVKQDADKIVKMFLDKNEIYGTGENTFMNFHDGALLIFGDSTPETRFRTLVAYTAKHISAICKPEAIYNNPAFAESLLDIAVYALIGRAMKEDSINTLADKPASVFTCGRCGKKRTNYTDFMTHTRDCNWVIPKESAEPTPAPAPENLDPVPKKIGKFNRFKCHGCGELFENAASRNAHVVRCKECEL